MKPLSKGLKRILVFTVAIFIISIAYYIYVLSLLRASREKRNIFIRSG
jgi:hypothetical protein